MKTYKVITTHDVYTDDYENGEGEHVNFYQMDSIEQAETPREAIQKHFNKTLFLPINIEEAEANEEGTALLWANLVDEDNMKPSKHQLEEWKKGKLTLYSDHIEIRVKELTDIKFI